MLEPGQVVGGRYAVEGALSRGGFATIFRARHVILGTLHALKVLHTPSPDAQRRLLLEGQLQARLRHDNLILLTDAFTLDGVQEGVVVLVMELAEGPTLRQVLRRHPPALAQGLQLGTQLLGGVAYAHAAGLIHRDIKPANVLVCGTAMVPRLADFGLVKRLLTPTMGEGTRLGTMMGTPGYMAPEQYADAGRVDQRADVFSLGCVLYELLVGAPAFREGSPQEVLRRTVQGDFAPLPTSIPAAARQVILGALEPEPRQRTPSVAAMLERWRQATLDGVGEETDTGAAAPLSAGLTLETLAPSLTLAPTNLPEPPDPFIGREDELAQLRAQLRPGALVTVRGPGGTGKTRISQEIGRALRGAFAGGVWFIDLSEAHTLDDVCAALARALRITPQADAPLEALGWALRRRGEILLILDNCEQIVADAAAAVRSWRGQAPEACFLVTSRAPLELQGEQHLELQPFNPPPDDALPGVVLASPGARLLQTRAQARQPAFVLALDDAPAVGALLRSVDGLPLAIELIAAQAASRPLAEVQQRLEGRLLQVQSRRRDLPARQRTLHSTIAWSWTLLSPAEQSVLAQASVLEGPFGLDAAEAILVSPDPALWIEDVLERLLEQSLLRRDRQTGRFGMLVSIREFAAARLAEHPDQQAVRERHLAYFAQVTMDSVEQLASLEDLLAASRQPGTAAGQVALLAAGVLQRRGAIRRSVALLREVLDRPGALSPAQQVRAWSALGLGLGSLLEHEAAQDSLAHALALAETVGDPSAEGYALVAEVERLWMIADAQGALALAPRAIACMIAADDAAGLVQAQCNYANILLGVGRVAEAGPQYQEALVRARQVGRDLEMEVTRCMGAYLERVHRYEEAMVAYRAAIAYFAGRQDAATASQIMGNMALLLRNQGRHEEAQQVYLEALSCAQGNGDRFIEGMMLLHLARLGLLRGELEQARAWGQTAREVIMVSNNPRFHGVLLRILIEIALASQDTAGAWSLLGEAGAHQVGLESVLPLMEAELRMLEGQGEVARPLLEKALEVLKGQEEEGWLRAMALRGILDAEAGDVVAARAGLAVLEATRPLPRMVQDVLARLALLVRGADA